MSQAEYITMKELKMQTGLSKATLNKKLSQVRARLSQVGKIVKNNGKATLYHKSMVAQFLANEPGKIEPPLSHVSQVEPPHEGSSFNEEFKLKIQENQNLKNSLESLKLEVINYQKQTEKLIDQLVKKDDISAEQNSRHDTIVLTMSRQLESLNEKFLLLEDKREEEKDGQFIKNNNFNVYNVVIKASTIAILIIIYFKILYI